MNCTGCAALLPTEAISDALGAARCPSCGALVDLRGGGRGTLGRAAGPKVAIPEKWIVEEVPNALVVRWRWFTWISVILIPFTIFWNSILFTMAWGFSDQLRHPERLLLALLVPHVWIGVGLVYYCLASFVNSTTVRAGQGMVSVRIGPLPWRGKRDLPVGELEQLFVVDHHSKNNTTFDVCALMRGGRKQVLVRGLGSQDQARFLEWRLERLLGITDHPVVGELRRD